MKNSPFVSAPTQRLMQTLSRELDGWTVLVSPICPDGSIFARLYSQSGSRAVAIPFDVREIGSDTYVRGQLAKIQKFRHGGAGRSP